MKKTYIAPNVNTVKVGVSRMVCASSGTLDNTKSINSSDGFGSRGHSNWDDDEEY